MSAQELSHSCQRCHVTLKDQRFFVNIDADPPLSAPIELQICERCMKSMTRWISRPPRHDRADPIGLSEKDRSEHRSRGRRRNLYTQALDKHEAWAKRVNWLPVAAVFASLIMLAGLAAIMSTALHTVGHRREGVQRGIEIPSGAVAPLTPARGD
jgi:hypothetical protein